MARKDNSKNRGIKRSRMVFGQSIIVRLLSPTDRSPDIVLLAQCDAGRARLVWDDAKSPAENAVAAADKLRRILFGAYGAGWGGTWIGTWVHGAGNRWLFLKAED